MILLILLKSLNSHLLVVVKVKLDPQLFGWHKNGCEKESKKLVSFYFKINCTITFEMTKYYYVL